MTNPPVNPENPDASSQPQHEGQPVPPVPGEQHAPQPNQGQPDPVPDSPSFEQPDAQQSPLAHTEPPAHFATPPEPQVPAHFAAPTQLGQPEQPAAYAPPAQPGAPAQPTDSASFAPTTPQPQYAPPAQQPAAHYAQSGQPQYTQPGQPYAQPPQQFAGQPGAPVPPGPKKTNVLGIIGLAVAALGLILACIPFVMFIGWILLPIGFILGIVSLFMKNQGKGLGIAAIIVSVVGTILGIVMFFFFIGSAVNSAISIDDTSIATPDGEELELDEAESTEGDLGTRANPFPIGTVIEQGDWTLTVNSVNLNANDILAAEDLFNDAPDAGTVYIMVNITATYTGDNPDGEMPWPNVAYVTTDGNTIESYDKFVFSPDEFDLGRTLYEGASTTGNISIQVPADTAADGVLAVNPSMLGDKVFVAVQ